MAACRAALALVIASVRSASGSSGVVAVSDQQLLPGLSLSWEPIGSDGIQFIVTYASEGWFGIGFSQGTQVVRGTMHGEGQGADLFYCSGGEVQRFWATMDSVGAGTAVPGATCSQASGESTMTFSRTLAASGDEERAVTPGTQQMIVFASGTGPTVFYHGTSRGAMLVDFGAAPAVATPAPPPSGGAGSVGTATDLALGDGVSLSFAPSGSDSAQFTVRKDGSRWLAYGFSNGDSLSMIGGGAGSDVFACADGSVRRYWITSYGIGPGEEVVDATCTQTGSSTELTFTRTLAAASQEVPISSGFQQAIYAFGSEGQTMIQRHSPTNRGGVRINYETGSGEESQLKAPAGLYIHLILMVISWGGLLPLGAAAANRLRSTAGQDEGPPKAWFKLHRNLQIVGWFLQILGFLAAIWYVQENSTHFDSPHTVIGLVVVIIGTLQPLNAAVRPHPPGEGEKKSVSRLAFEVVHKGLGWLAVLLGVTNCVIGIVLLNSKGFESVAVIVAAVITAICMLPTTALLAASVCGPNNPVAKALLGVKSTAAGNAEP